MLGNLRLCLVRMHWGIHNQVVQLPTKHTVRTGRQQYLHPQQTDSAHSFVGRQWTDARCKIEKNGNQKVELD